MKKQTKLGLVLAAAALISVSVASLVSARGWVQNGADWFYVDNDGEYVTETIQTSGNTKFYLGEDGSMQKDYFLEDYNSNTYYFGSNGAMVTNTWVAIEADRTDNQGDYVPDNYWYYFQASGKAVKGTSDKPKKTTIDGKKYMFNEYGQMCTGWIDENGQVIDPDADDEGGPFVNAWYYAGGDNDGVLRSGWVTYYDGWNGDGYDYQTEKTNIYFYFNTTNNKKYGAGESNGITKKINGKTYAFDSNGMMLSGWDQVDEQIVTSLNNKTVYFSGEDDGHQVKKGWVYAVPAESVDQSAYEDGEEKYFYFGSSGDATKDQFKKINGKYYAFNPAGIMKTGVVVWCAAPGTNTSGVPYKHFLSTLDLDWAEGSEVAKKGLLRTDKNDDDYIVVNRYGEVLNNNSVSTNLKSTNSKYTDWVDTTTPKKVKLHLFGDDGARKTGTNTVNFADDVYTFVSNASGNKESGVSNKKYYSLGIQLKATADIKYGIYVTTESWFKPQRGSIYENALAKTNINATSTGDAYYEVLNTAGSKVKNAVKKDADGNYWVVDKNNHLCGIYNLEVKSNKTKTYNFVIATGSQFSNTDEGKEYTWMYGTDKFMNDTDEADSAAIKTAIGAAFANGIFETEFFKDNAIKFKAIKATTLGGVSGYEEVAVTVTGNQFKSEYDGKSNVMLPFGVKDDTLKSARKDFDEDAADAWYQVIPNNDYFLNCYWAD